MQQKKTLSQRLTQPYRLVVRSEEDFAVRKQFRFNYAKVIVFSGLLVAILFAASFYVSKAWLLYWFESGGEEARMRRQMIQLSLATDSLAEQVSQRDQFILSFQKVVSSGDELEAEAHQLEKEEVDIERESVAESTLDDLSDIDTKWRKDFESKHSSDVIMSEEASTSLENVFLFSPINGIVSSDYDTKIGHYGVDVVAKKNEPVHGVADGTVIIASWTEDTGYTIAIQHANNLISIYKHNSSLSKKVGDFVKAGEVVSIIGNTGELTTGPHLHFELWYDGKPIDPKNYVKF
ncbi:Peptidase family M23 [Catalinimonas alkaloidigena]|uniref:Peptidase family M23 n=1 Tax=Catalinimonas alkaloidigena TaxID=1075417 RepID=A0A1G9E7D0_9BACT|nr:M23 family metallopeptidase [Catalinimonas alkaloidigena]SDK72033.1 Peptidase family M23 [Catalinimonas alkaloidigena]